MRGAVTWSGYVDLEQDDGRKLRYRIEAHVAPADASKGVKEHYEGECEPMRDFQQQLIFREDS